MKTSRLVDVLAAGAGPAPRALAARRLAPVAVGGIAVAALTALVALGPAPAQMLEGPALWVKLAYAGLMAGAAGRLAARLGRPAAPARGAWQAVLGVAALMALLGLAWFLATPVGERATGLLGHSWLVCPWNVLALSLPGLAGALWAVRGLAPTRPRAAGFAAGLFAGALGAAGYALACPEASLSFVAAWYSLGMALSGLVGAWLGPRFLRW